MIKPELFQNLLRPSVVKGDIIPLKTTAQKHWDALKKEPVPESGSINFADALNRAFLKVNDQQVNSENLVQKLVSDPKSVNVHDVLIAGEKAKISLTFTKTISDLVVKTYRELINLR